MNYYDLYDVEERRRLDDEAVFIARRQGVEAGQFWFEGGEIVHISAIQWEEGGVRIVGNWKFKVTLEFFLKRAIRL